MKTSATTLKGIAIFALLFAIQVSHAAESLNSQAFQQARQQIADMLSGKTALNFERAVFLTENAFWNNELDETGFSEFINHHALQIQKLVQANNTKTESDFKPHIYKNAKEQYDIYLKSLANWAIFTYLTDTTYFLENNNIYYHLPYTYSNNDPLGTLNFSNTQVNKLLYADDRSGNCYALTALFKMLSERLQSNAAICTAPGHIYIRHADPNGILFNVELATRAFPGTGSISTLTYTTNQAIESGISMRMLNLKESVALTLIYLAKGYQHRFNTTTDNFMLECAELALQHDSLNLNAMLLKAAVLESRLLQQNKNTAQLKNDKLFQEYEQHITRVFNLGYREMPKDMKALVINKLRNPDEPIWAADKTPNAFADLLNAKSRFATLSWGLFDEQMLTKPVEYYGRTAYNTATRKIQQFIPKDSLKDYPIDPVVFALSIDPLAHKFPSMSPYNAFANNPILFVDMDGREGTIYISVLKTKEGKPVLDKVDLKVVREKLIKTYQDRYNVDIDVKFDLSGKVFSKKEFENRTEYKKSDHYLIVGKPEQLITIDENKSTGWEHLGMSDEVKRTVAYQESVTERVNTINGYSADEMNFGMINSDNIQKDNKQEFNSYEDKLANTIAHEKGHRDFRYLTGHGGNEYGVSQHTNNGKIMDEKPINREFTEKQRNTLIEKHGSKDTGRERVRNYNTPK